MKRMNKNLVKGLLSLMLSAVTAVQLTSCGTLLYPERRGQRSGQIDLAVALMDGIGLFFFIIPGVIAFAVDIDTGAIYLPSTGRYSNNRYSKEDARTGTATDGEATRVVMGHSDQLTADALERIVVEQTGCAIRLDDARLIVRKMDEPVDINRELLRLRSAYGAPCLSGAKKYSDSRSQ
jgi:hypothetical protein